MKPLCHAPFIGMYATSYGLYAPCCSSKKFKFDSPEQYWNSEQLKSIRDKVNNNQWPDECSVCKQQTELGVFSDRDLYDRLYKQLDCSNNIAGPVIFDLRPGNRCNLKCRMCSPHGSDLIEKEVNDHTELSEFYSIENENKDSVDLSDFIIDSQVKWLKVLGGEPSIDPDVCNVLENLVSNKKTDMMVMITTNATNYNNKFYSLLEKFKNVTVKFSIDGAGLSYEYIRTNAKWKKTSKNVEKILSDNKYSKYIISPVLQPYNLPTFTDFLDWLLYLYNKDYKFIVSYHHSDDLKTHASVLDNNHISYCREIIDIWANDKDPSFLQHINYKSLIVLLDIQHNPKAKNTFIKFNNTLDRIRKTNIEDIHPILAQYK